MNFCNNQTLWISVIIINNYEKNPAYWLNYSLWPTIKDVMPMRQWTVCTRMVFIEILLITHRYYAGEIHQDHSLKSGTLHCHGYWLQNKGKNIISTVMQPTPFSTTKSSYAKANMSWVMLAWWKTVYRWITFLLLWSTQKTYLKHESSNFIIKDNPVLWLMYWI